MKTANSFPILIFFLFLCGHPFLYAGERRASLPRTRGNVKESNEKWPTLELAVIRALQYLKSEQQPDGSWPGKDKITTTAIAYAAFVWHGETPKSYQYGEVVRKAEGWLISATPKTVEQKAALCLAALLHVASMSNVVPELKQIAADFPLANNELEQLPKTWQVWLALTRFPDSYSKPTFLVDNHERLQSSFATKQAPRESSEGEVDYLHFYAVTLAKWMGGRKSWNRHDHLMGKILTPLQDKNGAFPATRSQSSSANTALAALSMQVYYAYNMRHLDRQATGTSTLEIIFDHEQDNEK